MLFTLYWMPVQKVIENFCVGVNIHYFRCSKGDLYAKILSMSNILNAPRKKRRDVGASWSVLLIYLHPAKFIYYRYPNKDKRDALGGIIITRRDIIRVNRWEQICIFFKRKDFGDHKLHWVQKWIIVIREGVETHVLEYSEEKEDLG